MNPPPQRPPAPLIEVAFVTRNGYRRETNAEDKAAAAGGVRTIHLLGLYSRLAVVLGYPHNRFILRANAPPNIDFRYDTLLRLKRRALESDTDEELLDSRRFTFTNTETGTNAGTQMCLNMPANVQAHLTASVNAGNTVVTCFLIEIDHIYQTETTLSTYTVARSPTDSVLWVKTDDGDGDVAVFVNASLLSLHSGRYRREYAALVAGTRLVFADVCQSDCALFLHQVYTDKALAWHTLFALMATAERFESSSVWNRCAAFAVHDHRRSLGAKLVNTLRSVRNERAKWALITELVASASATHVQRMFEDGFNAYAVFQLPEDRAAAARLFESKQSGTLRTSPNAFSCKPRQFDHASKADTDSITVNVVGSNHKLTVNSGIIQTHHTKPIESVTAEDQEIFKIYLRFVYPERQRPSMKKLGPLLRFATQQQLAWFTNSLQTMAVAHYSLAATKGALPVTSMWTLLELAYEYRLENLKSMLLYWLQCADDAYWRRMTAADALAYWQAARRFATLDDEVRQARHFGWVVHDRLRLAAGVNLGSGDTAVGQKTSVNSVDQRRLNKLCSVHTAARKRSGGNTPSKNVSLVPRQAASRSTVTAKSGDSDSGARIR